jgi:hypothetical protein
VGCETNAEQALKTTAITDKPAFVEPFKPIEGPTVWYGEDLDVQASNSLCRQRLLTKSFLIAVGLVLLRRPYCFQAAQLPPTSTTLVLHNTDSVCFLLLKSSSISYWSTLGAQDVAYEFTPREIEEILKAVASVEKRQLKASDSTQCSAAGL